MIFLATWHPFPMPPPQIKWFHFWAWYLIFYWNSHDLNCDLLLTFLWPFTGSDEHIWCGVEASFFSILTLSSCYRLTGETLISVLEKWLEVKCCKFCRFEEKGFPNASVLALKGRYPSRQKPKISTKSHYTANLTQEIYSQGKSRKVTSAQTKSSRKPSKI